MSPSQLLAAFPADATIVHELGHMVIGFELGVQEDCIEFVRVISDEVARSWFSEARVMPEQLMKRALAGMYFQARLASRSFDADFSERVIDQSLFAVATPTILDATMIAQGLGGDWARAKARAAQLNPDPVAQISLIQQAAKSVRDIAAARQLDVLVGQLRDELKTWLAADHEDAPYMSDVMYSAAGPRKRWSAWSP